MMLSIARPNRPTITPVVSPRPSAAVAIARLLCVPLVVLVCAACTDSPLAGDKPCQNDPCGTGATCIAVFGGHACVCPPGTLGDPSVACGAVDTCTNAPCGANAECAETPTGRTCACPLGFNGDPNDACTDIDACLVNTCGANAICADAPAPADGNTRTCVCDTGFQPDPSGADAGCVAIVVCTTNACADNATCINNAASATGYNCACNPGFDGDAETGCVEINACATNGCGANATCTDAPAPAKGDARTCACNPGFDGDAETGCVDIDECATNPCGVNTTCNNETNRYSCACSCAAPTPFCVEFAAGFTCYASETIPTDDPYLASTAHWADWEYVPLVLNGCTGQARKDATKCAKIPPWHRLDALHADLRLRSTAAGFSRWYFPDVWDNANTKALVAAKASETVFYSDLLTGATVQIVARSPMDETVPYTNEGRFNSNGAILRVGDFPSNNAHELRRTDGTLAGQSPYCREIPGQSADCVDGNVLKKMSWDENDPGRYYYDSSGPPGSRLHATVGRSVAVADSLFDFPDKRGTELETIGVEREIADDFDFLVLYPPSSPYASGTTTRLRMAIYERVGWLLGLYPVFGSTPKKYITLHTVSPVPTSDTVGTVDFLRDEDARLYLRYSLNKGQPAVGQTASNGGPNNRPYQNYLVAVADDREGPEYIALSPKSEVINPEDCEDPELCRGLFLMPAGELPVTGHGGLSPSRDYYATHDEDEAERTLSCKKIRDFSDPENGREYRMDFKMPGCDHMDWTIDDDHFYIWARVNGTPIYQVNTFLNDAYELKAAKTMRVVATQGCRGTYVTDLYHSTSPDSTKVLYQSGMLTGAVCRSTDPAMANTLDLFMAIVGFPKPPSTLQLTQAAEGV